MAELVDRDEEHLRLLKLGYYIMAGMMGFFSLFSLIYIFLGGIFASGAIPVKDGSRDDPRLMGIIFLGLGIGVLLIGLTATSLTYFTGRSLRDRRHRVFCLIIAALCCLQIPWGTAIGVCTFMVLGRPSVKAQFEPHAPPPPTPAPTA